MAADRKKSEPLPRLAMWGGFDTLGPRDDQVIRLPFPENAGGRVGLVAYDGDRVSGGDSLTMSAGCGPPAALGDPANPLDTVLTSTISEPEPAAPKRVPAYPNTVGHDSDVLELGEGIRRGGERLAFLVSRRDPAWVGALLAAVGAKQ